MLNNDIAVIRAVHADRLSRDLAAVEVARKKRGSGRSIRRSIGRLMVRAGHRLAAESPLELARTR